MTENQKTEKIEEVKEYTKPNWATIEKTQITGETEKAYFVSFPETSKYSHLEMVIPKSSAYQCKSNKDKLNILLLDNPSFKCKDHPKNIAYELTAKKQTKTDSKKDVEKSTNKDDFSVTITKEYVEEALKDGEAYDDETIKKFKGEYLKEEKNKKTTSKKKKAIAKAK